MIRYPVTLDELRALIEAEAPGWLARAAERTERFRGAGRYDEASGIWSEVKKVYMRLQHDKCAYCERQLASEDFGGAIEHDIEHYRPKNGVRRWPSEEIAQERGLSYEFSTGEELPEGYYLLAYHPLNYATACKKCNSPLKASYFPIAGPRGPQSDDPATLRGEAPFLNYPLGELDEDPEEILTFLGINPVPRAADGARRDRARVIIDFFELGRREDLWRERASKIVFLFLALKGAWSGEGEEQEIAREAVETLVSPAGPHTNCARAFRSLYERAPAKAAEIARAAQAYLKSQS
jgi:hypothetical protein